MPNGILFRNESQINLACKCVNVPTDNTQLLFGSGHELHPPGGGYPPPLNLDGGVLLGGWEPELVHVIKTTQRACEFFPHESNILF